jgi:hypothetical protein
MATATICKNADCVGRLPVLHVSFEVVDAYCGSMPEPSAPNATWAAYLHAMQGDSAMHDGDLDAAYSSYEASLAAFDRAGDVLGRSIPLRALAAMAILQSDYRAAHELFQESLAGLETAPRSERLEHNLRLGLQGLALVSAALKTQS